MASKMQYRRLGGSGVQVSVLSFGSWVSFDNQLKDDLALECMQAAYDAGCNFFDNAEAYAAGESEAGGRIQPSAQQTDGLARLHRKHYCNVPAPCDRRAQ